ncbi:uncharacterized protein LOC110267565 [Arachis ipaensis]|uniref:uncharacterized protein LOC110267565 n=1 Tax=Arachis ipaensis TaxID=130454 RepID=UPI000A2B3F69|nr:uncharacterized protein LOC110267565 [Arachis ipaensis]XP_025635311.2 uncharacterized protein LOC112729196 [Arachis hypogaea]QHO23482.1 uncharacterized protein DS421_12g363930 [Arachis hypogaea]
MGIQQQREYGPTKHCVLRPNSRGEDLAADHCRLHLAEHACYSYSRSCGRASLGILEGKRIFVLPLIRDSMWKVTQQQKYNILFPSMITRLATLSRVERRLTNRTSVYVSKHPYLPYGEYDGPPQKKRKTTEPPSSSEPSAPTAPSAHTPQLQTPYELGREILQTLHRYERHNAHRFQWIVAKFEGRDPGPPPSDTPELEAEIKEAAVEEPAVDRAEERAEQPTEPSDQAVQEPAAETTTEPTRAIIVY